MLKTINMIMAEQGTGVIYVDDKANVIASNKLADNIFQKMDGVVNRSGKLSFYDEDAIGKFTEIVKTVFHQRLEKQMYVKRKSNNPPFKLDFFPFIDCLRGKELKPHSVILISESKNEPIFPEWIFKNYYHLTQAEIATTKAVFENISLQAHAKQRGIKVATVRWTLLNVFSKTYTNSQKELIALVMQYAN